MILQLAGVDYLAIKTNEVQASRAAGEQITPGQYFLMWKVDLASWFVAGQKKSRGDYRVSRHQTRQASLQ